MTIAVGKIKGVTATVQAALRAHAVYDSDQLVAAARTAADRQQLAQSAGVDSQVILKLVNRADLARVRGIGAIFSDLLEEVGVDTVKELAARNPIHLHEAIAQVNLQKQLAQRAPSTDMVRSWVAQARRLSAALEY